MGLHPLNRHPLAGALGHDPESLRYLEAEGSAPTSPVVWTSHIGRLDQGQVGSCTGNGAVDLLGCDPYFPTLPPGTVLDEQLALALYHQATVLDPYPGTYPPDDTGSDGLSVAKAAVQAGLASGYTHATSTDAALSALARGPVLTGVNWYDGFDYPDSAGHVRVSGSVRGGHEFAVVGVNPTAQAVALAPSGFAVSVPAGSVVAMNSWGSSWAAGGYFTFSVADWSRLLSEQGDVTVLTPLSQPAPTPTPPPGDQADHAFALVLHKWLARNPWFYKDVQQGGRDWLSAKGL